MADWKIANPTYMRSSEAGAELPYYSFRVVTGADYSETLIYTKKSLQSANISTICAPASLQAYLFELYSHFLQIHKHRFAKPYTPAQLIKVSHHILTLTDAPADEDQEVEWTFRAAEIQVRGGSFHLIWNTSYKVIHFELDVADNDNTITNEAPTDDILDGSLLDEVSLDEIPAAEDNIVFRPRIRQDSDEEKQKERKRVEEARIKVKWAHYKAEKAMAKYLEKYGDYDEFLSSSSEEEFSSSSDEMEKSS